jgi:hypothetical protein
MVRFQICLDISSFRALRLLAEQEYRDPRAQAAIILHRELERTGLLANQDTQTLSNNLEAQNGK